MFHLPQEAFKEKIGRHDIHHHDTQRNDTQHNDTQHNYKNATLSITALDTQYC